MDHDQMSSPCPAGTPGTASQSSVTCATSEWSIAGAQSSGIRAEYMAPENVTYRLLYSYVRSGWCTCTRVSTTECTQASLEYNGEREREFVF